MSTTGASANYRPCPIDSFGSLCWPSSAHYLGDDAQRLPRTQLRRPPASRAQDSGAGWRRPAPRGNPTALPNQDRNHSRPLRAGPDEILGPAGDGQQLQLQDVALPLQVEEGYRAPPQVLAPYRRLVGWGWGSGTPRRAAFPYRGAPIRSPLVRCGGLCDIFRGGAYPGQLRRGDRHIPPHTIHHDKTCQKRNPRASATR